MKLGKTFMSNTFNILMLKYSLFEILPKTSDNSGFCMLNESLISSNMTLYWSKHIC